ncbi:MULTISPECIES: hypothetical protein [unclassified Pseudomonas]|uniref:hypothetical protein n=1 Tax=unclassified Pseudomonas TaxID=196821 RepID=UPI00244999A9|nr:MULTISPECIES: hypothetical protein [unclassified Pseudomonas]MDG9923925.1 hypothetical protein [Pseudomonas sp. GD04045]MDH0035088.1 hypothetical protein [Pseudomonas sp. GD04019]
MQCLTLIKLHNCRTPTATYSLAANPIHRNKRIARNTAVNLCSRNIAYYREAAMLNPHQHNCHTPIKTTTQSVHLKDGFAISTLKLFALICISLLASGFQSTVEARSSALEVDLPDVQGWQIEAVKRLSSVMCSARQSEENGRNMTLLADTGKYRDGVWFLQITTRNQQLEPGVDEAAASLSLNGQHVLTGKALAVGDWTGDKRTSAYVRFDFPVIDPYIKDIKAARVVEVQVQGLPPLKLESLAPIIATIENCQQESLSDEFWKDAKLVCN